LIEPGRLFVDNTLALEVDVEVNFRLPLPK